MRIYTDDNGNVIDYLGERNEKIKEQLEPILSDFLVEKALAQKMKKPINLGYRFTKQLYSVLATYPKMNADDFVRLDYDDINDYWLKYLELTAYYNRYFEIVDNKQTLMAYMGINSRQYKDLERHDDEDIKSLMSMINNAYIGLGFIANESGNADSRATMGRLSARELGHGLVKESEGQMIDAVTSKTPKELERQLQNLIGGEK